MCTHWNWQKVCFVNLHCRYIIYEGVLKTCRKASLQYVYSKSPHPWVTEYKVRTICLFMYRQHHQRKPGIGVAGCPTIVLRRIEVAVAISIVQIPWLLTACAFECLIAVQSLWIKLPLNGRRSCVGGVDNSCLFWTTQWVHTGGVSHDKHSVTLATGD